MQLRTEEGQTPYTSGDERGKKCAINWNTRGESSVCGFSPQFPYHVYRSLRQLTDGQRSLLKQGVFPIKWNGVFRALPQREATRTRPGRKGRRADCVTTRRRRCAAERTTLAVATLSRASSVRCNMVTATCEKTKWPWDRAGRACSCGATCSSGLWPPPKNNPLVSSSIIPGTVKYLGGVWHFYCFTWVFSSYIFRSASSHVYFQWNCAKGNRFGAFGTEKLDKQFETINFTGKFTSCALNLKFNRIFSAFIPKVWMNSTVV